MDFDIPEDIEALLKRLDIFIDDVIKPLEQTDDNERFFDHPSKKHSFLNK